MSKIRYLYHYVIHPGPCPDTQLGLDLAALVAHYGLEKELADGRVQAYEIGLRHRPGTVHLFPTRVGLYESVRKNLERELSGTRLMKRLAREGVVRCEPVE